MTQRIGANNTVEKTVKVTANPQYKLHIQPWLEGLKLRSTSDLNYGGHISYTFTRSPNVTVNLHLQK